MFFDYDDLLNLVNAISTFVAQLGIIIFENKSQGDWIFGAALCAFFIVLGARGGRILADNHTIQARALRFGLGTLPFGLGFSLTIGTLFYGVLCVFLDSHLNELKISSLTSTVIFAAVTVWQPFLLSLFFSFLFTFILFRHLEPWLANALTGIVKKQKYDVERSDVNKLTRLLSENMKYDPLNFIEKANKHQKIFWGIGADKKAIAAPIHTMHSKNAAVIGPPGTGKSVAMTNIAVQEIKLGNCAIVFDPKADEHCPQVMQNCCIQQKLPFVYLDLAADSAQFNPFKNASENEVRELLENALGLHDQGGEADFYRLNDRKGLKTLLENVDEFTLSEISCSAREKLGSFADKCISLISKIEEIALVRSCSANSGVDFENVLKKGGCIYVKGSMRSSRVKMVQVLFLARLIQLVEKRPERQGPHALFVLDEVKFLMSKVLLDSFGVIRSKNARFIIAFQSLSDTSSQTCGVSESIASQTILDNCQIRLIYRTKSPDVAEWAERQTGTTLVPHTVRDVKISNEAAELASQDYNVSALEVSFIDKNSILHLPDMCALCIGIEEAKLLFTSPIAYKPRVLEVMRFAPVLTNVEETLL